MASNELSTALATYITERMGDQQATQRLNAITAGDGGKEAWKKRHAMSRHNPTQKGHLAVRDRAAI